MDNGNGSEGPDLDNMTCRVPHVTVRGTYYEVGYQVGKQFEMRIKQFYAEFEDATSLRKFSESDEGRNHLERWLTASKATFPNVVAEMRGLADGAGLSFEEVFLFHCYCEVGILMDANKDGAPESLPSSNCSSLQLAGKNMLLSCHNEDNPPSFYNRCYLIQAEIVVDGIVEEKYIALTTPGVVPGKAACLNHHGMAFTCNCIYMKTINTSKNAAPRAVMSRALLGLKSVDEVLTNVLPPEYEEDAKWQTVAPFNLNLSSRYWHAIAVFELFSTVSVHMLNGGFLHHFNMFVFNTTESCDDTSSLHRNTTLATMTTPHDKDSLLAVLADQSDEQFPFFRDGRPSDGCMHTCATVVLDVIEGTVEVYTTRPLPGSKPAFTLRMDMF